MRIVRAFVSLLPYDSRRKVPASQQTMTDHLENGRVRQVQSATDKLLVLEHELRMTYGEAPAMWRH